jgi:hypothetical protein
VTTTGQQIVVPTCVDRGVSHGQRDSSPMAINLSFLDQSRHFFFHVAHLGLRGWVDPIPDPTTTQKIW